MGDASEPPNLCFLSAQPTFEKSSRITPSAGGAERGREPARGRRANPATTPGKFNAKVGPESVSSRRSEVSNTEIKKHLRFRALYFC